MQQHNAKDQLGYVRGKDPVKGEPTLPIHMWQSLMECDTHCPSYDYCVEDKNNLARCQVQATYLQDIFAVLCKRALNAGLRTEHTLMEIGIHLMPLYAQLMRFLIVEYGTRHTIYMDDKGKYHIHPIFKEIRATIRDIFAVQKQVFREHAFMMGDVSDAQPNMKHRIHGHPGYYEAVVAGTKPPRTAMPYLVKERTGDQS